MIDPPKLNCEDLLSWWLTNPSTISIRLILYVIHFHYYNILIYSALGESNIGSDAKLYSFSEVFSLQLGSLGAVYYQTTATICSFRCVLELWLVQKVSPPPQEKSWKKMLCMKNSPPSSQIWQFWVPLVYIIYDVFSSERCLYKACLQRVNGRFCHKKVIDNGDGTFGYDIFLYC